MDYTKSTERLEEIIALLNDPQIDIDKSLELFSEGVQIVKNSYEEISKASGRVTELKKELDKYKEIKFDEE